MHVELARILSLNGLDLAALKAQQRRNWMMMKKRGRDLDGEGGKGGKDENGDEDGDEDGDGGN